MIMILFVTTEFQVLLTLDLVSSFFFFQITPGIFHQRVIFRMEFMKFL